MALIIPPGYCQVTLVCSDPNVATGRTALVLGFGLGDFLEDELENAAVLVRSAWLQGFAPYTDNSITLTEVSVVTETLGATVQAAQTGQANYAQPPPNVAALVTKTTTARGRRGRGRSYLHGMLQENEVDERGIITLDRVNTVQAAVDDFYDALQPTVGNALGDEVILQNTTPTSGPDVPANPTPPITPPPRVSRRTVSVLAATQRRRLRR